VPKEVDRSASAIQTVECGVRVISAIDAYPNYLDIFLSEVLLNTLAVLILMSKREQV
jgi:hypothetical protein